MQTSQIQIGQLYAINTPNHGVVRFKPTSIRTVTIRTDKKATAANTSNHITGVIAEGDMPGTETERTREVSPEAIIDHYTAYAALKAKQDEEKRVRQEAEDNADALRERLRAKLYEITGLQRPEKPIDPWKPYKEPFSTPHGNKIFIEPDVMETLLNVLESVEWAMSNTVR